MKVRFIIKAMPERQEFIEYLRRHLPDAEFCMDRGLGHWDTFCRSLEMAGEDMCVHMEEDVLLTQNFETKILSAIKDKPFHLIQFFSMRKADQTIGSRWDRNFLMNQCWYAPPSYSSQILNFASQWYDKMGSVHPTGSDTMVCDFLKARKEDYWIHVPSLVQHRVAVSMIDSRRSSKRQSLTFRDGIDDDL